MKGAWIAMGLLALIGCGGGIPSGIVAVKDLDAERYLGTWYEIARLDHRFERGLSDVSATYAKREGGGLSVLNKGFDTEAQEWKSAEGRAYFTGEPGEGRLKVTFFWPFYGGYNVIDLDREGYRWALVCGNDRSYLWILARSTTLDSAVRDALLEKARSLGFDVDALIWVTHERESE
jgi:apolipoprotein D and lipocalin family protein